MLQLASHNAGYKKGASCATYYQGKVFDPIHTYSQVEKALDVNLIAWTSCNSCNYISDVIACMMVCRSGTQSSDDSVNGAVAGAHIGSMLCHTS